MSEVSVSQRSEIEEKYKWNAASVFESPHAWEAEAEDLLGQLGKMSTYKGRLSEGPHVLTEALAAGQELEKRLGQVIIYAAISYLVDTTNQAAGAMYGRAQGLAGQAQAATSFIEPELLAIGEPTLKDWASQHPELAVYQHYFHNLFRRQAHVRSGEVEEVLGMLTDPFTSTHLTANMLIDADFNFTPATSSSGELVPITAATIDKILANTDRETRRTGYESYTNQFLAFKNTLGNNLATSIKQNVFQMRTRRYETTLEMALSQINVPPQVFHNLIDTFRKNLPTWHRYWNIRRRALGVEKLHPDDIWAPLTQKPPHFTYEEAVERICTGLAPMGREYVETVRRGCLEQGWVDVYPNKGKTGGAFSYGSPGTHPFIVTNFEGTIFSLSTLAHELGHSMHSYLTWSNQPIAYSQYSLFVAEVASNFHQAMVRANLLNSKRDPDFQISLIEEAMSNFHRYFFIMPTLARFELEAHQRIERGQALTADSMNELMADLFEEGYGGEMELDRARVGITWATFGHLYTDYYVYQYATGISGVNALARRILEGAPGAVDQYMSFLKAGGSLYPLEALQKAGVDLTSPEPVEQTFGVLTELVDRLEVLINSGKVI